MNNLKAYLDKRGITEEQMEEGRRATRAYIDAFNSSAKEESYRSLSDLAATVTIDEMKLAFGQFLDDFAHAHDKESLIADEPQWTSDPGRWRYDFAAAAHKLAHDNNLAVPQWVLSDEYVAETPFYAFNTEDPEFQAYLRETTPREFQQRNLFLGENILKRA